MRGLTCTVCLVLVAMLVTAAHTAPNNPDYNNNDQPCPTAPTTDAAARDLIRPRLEKRQFGAIAKFATKIFGKVFNRGASKVVPEVAEQGVKSADDLAKAAAKNADDVAAAAKQSARVAASKLGGFKGFAARTGLTKRKFLKEAAITIIATAALNKAFNAFNDNSQRNELEEMTKNATIASDLASRGLLTQEEAANLGMFFDPASGVLELPPGVKIAPPPGAETVAFADVVRPPPGTAGAAGAAPAAAAAPPPPDPALLEEQTRNTTIAIDLAAQKKLTVEKAAELGLVFDPVAETLEVPDTVNIDALPDAPAPAGAAPAA